MWTVTDGSGNTATANQTVTVNALPSASITTNNSTICNGASATLTAATSSNVALNGLHFNGSGSIAVSSPTSIPVGNSPYTIEAWVKPTAAVYDGIAGWGGYGSTNAVNAFRLTGTTQ